MTNQYILVAVDTGQPISIPQGNHQHWTTSPEIFFGGASLIISLAALCVRQSLKERSQLIAYLQKQNNVLIEEIRED